MPRLNKSTTDNGSPIYETFPASPGMNRRDLKTVFVIGVLVAILVQPVIANVLPSAALWFHAALFAGLVILAPLALYIAFLLSRFWPVLYQFAKFAAVGTLNTVVDFGVLNLEIFFSGIYSGVVYSAFKAISFLASTTNSFFWNKYWTFSAGGKATAGETAKFYTVAVVGWILNVSAASLVVNVLKRPAIISPAIWDNVGALAGVAAAFLWDFLGYKYLVFKKTARQ
jgi:putative flippase GtrA